MFGYHVADANGYSVDNFDAEATVEQIIEKPEVPPSSHAITGLYFLD